MHNAQCSIHNARFTVLNLWWADHNFGKYMIFISTTQNHCVVSCELCTIILKQQYYGSKKHQQCHCEKLGHGT